VLNISLAVVPFEEDEKKHLHGPSEAWQAFQWFFQHDF